MSALRFDRLRYFAYGLLGTLNVLALLLHGLNLSTRGGGRGLGGSPATIPALVVVAGLCLLVVLVASVKRGRDLGLPAAGTLAGLVLSFSFPPALLVAMGFLLFAKARPAAARFGEPPPRAGLATGLWAAVNLAWPWFGLGVLSHAM